MSSYYREQGFHSRKRFLRRLRYVWALMLVGLLIAGGFFAYDAIRQLKQSDEASAPSNTVTSLVASNTELQSSQYFQFQSTKSWRIIANESRSNHFVYRKYDRQLIEQELVIDINRATDVALPLVLTTRVLPVKISGQGKISPAEGLSDHCKTGVKPAQGRNPLTITFKGVTFNCNPTTTNFIAVVGLVGGTDNMVLKRPDGSTAKYNITYKNLTAQPTAGDLQSMIETFETR